MKKVVIILSLLIFFFSCEKKFPGYTNKSTGIYMKLSSFDEDEKQFNDEYFTSADIKISFGDNLIFRHYKELIISPEDARFNFLFKFLNEGDSAEFKVSTQILKKEISSIFPNSRNVDYADVTVKIHHYYPKKEYLKTAKDVDDEMLEQLLLKKYLKENNITQSEFYHGIYVKRLKSGAGERIQKSKTISINYKGFFVNRLEFDNTYKETALTFTYGTPGQVIKGLEIALKGMRTGEKSKIIIPSQLAFGEEGSSTQIVPPFTTVIYELEIINVK